MAAIGSRRHGNHMEKSQQYNINLIFLSSRKNMNPPDLLSDQSPQLFANTNKIYRKKKVKYAKVLWSLAVYECEGFTIKVLFSVFSLSLTWSSFHGGGCTTCPPCVFNIEWNIFSMDVYVRSILFSQLRNSSYFHPDQYVSLLLQHGHVTKYPAVWLWESWSTRNVYSCDLKSNRKYSMPISWLSFNLHFPKTSNALYLPFFFFL